MAEASDLNPNPSRWSLLQIGGVCIFSSAGYWAMTSLPFYVYTHTAVFFFAFYLLLVLIGIPICYVQIKLGALYHRGVLGIFSHLVPLLKGVAVALLIMTYFRSITHALEISYGVYYMFASCQNPFPWEEKPVKNRSISSSEAKITIFDSVKTTPENTYFMHDFLQRSLHIGSWGPLVWYIVLSALFVWIFVYLLIMKGSSGFVKIMSVLAPLTGALLLILMIYGYAAVPDSSSRLYHFFVHEKETSFGMQNEQTSAFQMYLSTPKIWLDALDLHVYGLGFWAGTLPFLGTHITCRKKVINTTWLLLLFLYSVVPHILLLTLVPYIDTSYPIGSLDYEVGVKPGMSYLFVAIPHTFRKLGLSPFMAFLLFLTFIIISVQHLAFHILMIWENIWPSIPKAAMLFFKKTPFLLAAFCFMSFMFTAPYTSQCGFYLYEIIRHYVDRLLFALVIFSMVPFVIGFIRQETFRTPIDRIFMGIWYSVISLVAACLLLYNFVVFVYPEAVVAYEQKWAEQMGWCVSILPLLLGVIIGTLHTICTQQGRFKERILASLRVGSPPVDTGEDGVSIGTGDTDLKSPGPSRHTTPLTQARAPLLKHHGSPFPEKLSQGTENHTLFPKSLPTQTRNRPTPLQTEPQRSCINSPTGGRASACVGTDQGATVMSYGTLQNPKTTKANVEVVIRSASDGNVARL